MLSSSIIPLFSGTLIGTIQGSIATTCVCLQVIPPCQEKVWDITYAPSAQEGQATLVVTVPSLTGKVTEKVTKYIYFCPDTTILCCDVAQLQSVSSILTCDDLQVNGTGKSVLELNKVL